jgi:hypothetical protein
LKNPDPAEPEETTDSRREDSDRQAIERGEDDGMIVPGRVTSSVHKRGHPFATTER